LRPRLVVEVGARIDRAGIGHAVAEQAEAGDGLLLAARFELDSTSVPVGSRASAATATRLRYRGAARLGSRSRRPRWCARQSARRCQRSPRSIANAVPPPSSFEACTADGASTLTTRLPGRQARSCQPDAAGALEHLRRSLSSAIAVSVIGSPSRR
jgi:hypothetical protein